MSGWHAFVEDTLAPIYNAGQDIKKEVISDAVGVAKWGKDTTSAVANTVRNTAQGAEKLADAIPEQKATR